MKRILILFAHPALQQSRVNVRMLDVISGLADVTVNDLYEQYPEMHIDVRREQQLVEAHDIIIFHHPFFWYSTPPILKEWQDLVLEHGWAYGREGRKLAGKWFFNVMTAGGGREAYAPDGYNRFTIRQLLAPMEQTANLCRMRFLPPFVVHGTHAITPEATDRHAAQYRRLLEALRDERFEESTLAAAEYLNDLVTTAGEDDHA